MPSDRPTYFQTDLGQLIHLLSFVCLFSFFSLLYLLGQANCSRVILHLINLRFFARKRIKVFPQISANYSESEQPQLHHVAAGGS